MTEPEIKKYTRALNDFVFLCPVEGRTASWFANHNFTPREELLIASESIRSLRRAEESILFDMESKENAPEMVSSRG